MASERQPDHSRNRSHLLDLIARLHKAWEKIEDSTSDTVNLPELVKSHDTPLTLPELSELIRVDLDFQLRKGRRAVVESYFKAFPHLRGTSEQIELICEEYRLREKYGDKPSLGSYGERFPDLMEDLIARIYSDSIAPQSRSKSRKPKPSNALEDIAPTLHDLPPSLNSTPSTLYKFIRPLGSGTYGEVWLAEAPGKVEVAIKRLLRSVDDAEGQRELEVLELIKGLRHPFLLLTHAYYEEENRLHIVMELADSSLRDRFKECREEGLKGIPRDELLKYFDEAAKALDFLHGKKIQHRDIKPENILLVEGFVKVADFGLARQSQGHAGLDLSMASFCGSPHYIAPEVWAQQISPRSDQYSLAVSYVELRTGERPFSGRSFQDIMFAHLDADPALNELARSEQTVVRRALSKDPADRYGSCREFVQALKEAIEGSKSSEHVVLQEPEGNTGRQAWLIPVLLTALLMSAGGVAAWIFFKPDPQTVTVTPPPPKEEMILPKGFTPVGELKGVELPDKTVVHKQYYRTIATTYKGIKIEFCLIPSSEMSGSQFYMMKTEVSVKLYQAVAETDEYKKILKDIDNKDKFFEPSRNNLDIWWQKNVSNPDHPARGMMVLEAHCFCQALTRILKLQDSKIQLPTGPQWLKASGYYDWDGKNESGPFEQGWTPPEYLDINNTMIAVGSDDNDNTRKSPMSVGMATKDYTIYGCRDMSGNVLEWTRSLLGVPGHPTVPYFNENASTANVAVYSREFSKFHALKFTDIDDAKDSFQKPYYHKDNFLGFRAALSLSSKP